MSHPKIGIVLVNYNGENFQNDCMKTIYNQDYKNYTIVVVDNGSTDNSIELLKTNYPDVNIIETGQNSGVTRGNNIGINFAIKNNCDYVLLLNNDTELHPQMISNLIEKANEDIITVPKMYYFDPCNKLWCAGGRINWNKATTTHFGMGEYDNGQYNEERYVEYTPTCCMLIHVNVFKKVGLMDENYFMYYDDTDFCVRLNQKGYKILYVPEAVLWHKVSSSSGGELSLTTIYYGDRNRLYFIDKFYKGKLFVKTYYYLTRYIKLINWFFAKKDRKRIPVLLSAIRDYSYKKMGIKEN